VLVVTARASGRFHGRIRGAGDHRRTWGPSGVVRRNRPGGGRPARDGPSLKGILVGRRQVIEPSDRGPLCFGRKTGIPTRRRGSEAAVRQRDAPERFDISSSTPEKTRPPRGDFYFPTFFFEDRGGRPGRRLRLTAFGGRVFDCCAGVGLGLGQILGNGRPTRRETNGTHNGDSSSAARSCRLRQRGQKREAVTDEVGGRPRGIMAAAW